MGNKINPLIHRVSLFKNWKSKWFEVGNKFNCLLISDFLIRNDLNHLLDCSILYDIYIERLEQYTLVTLLTSSKVKNLSSIYSILNKHLGINAYLVNNITLKDSEFSVYSIFSNLRLLISKRRNYRIYIKNLLSNFFFKNVSGIKIIISGRVNAIDIARKEVFLLGNISLSSIDSFFLFKNGSFKTKYGVIGIKIYISMINEKTI
ncbi:hypothetical protein ACWNX4_00720 [Candidatus Vidania fulgoroideorum]